CGAEGLARVGERRAVDQAAAAGGEDALVVGDVEEVEGGARADEDVGTQGRAATARGDAARTPAAATAEGAGVSKVASERSPTATAGTLSAVAAEPATAARVGRPGPAGATDGGVAGEGDVVEIYGSVADEEPAARAEATATATASIAPLCPPADHVEVIQVNGVGGGRFGEEDAVAVFATD